MFHTAFSYVSTYYYENFESIAHPQGKLWFVKFVQLDVCGRSFFTNPVTYIDFLGGEKCGKWSNNGKWISKIEGESFGGCQ